MADDALPVPGDGHHPLEEAPLHPDEEAIPAPIEPGEPWLVDIIGGAELMGGARINAALIARVGEGDDEKQVRLPLIVEKDGTLKVDRSALEK